jgi:hypothetical protein
MLKTVIKNLDKFDDQLKIIVVRAYIEGYQKALETLEGNSDIVIDAADEYFDKIQDFRVIKLELDDDIRPII